MLFWQRSMKRLAATQMQMNRSNPDTTATAGYCKMIAIANTNNKIIATKLRIGVPFVFMGAKIQIKFGYCSLEPGKSDVTKCQGFLCREGNLVLSDGRFTVKVACRACDFDGWVWPLLSTYDIDITFDRLEEKYRMLVCRHLSQRQERQFRLFNITVVIKGRFHLTDRFTLHGDADGLLL